MASKVCSFFLHLRFLCFRTKPLSLPTEYIKNLRGRRAAEALGIDGLKTQPADSTEREEARMWKRQALELREEMESLHRKIVLMNEGMDHLPLPKNAELKSARTRSLQINRTLSRARQRRNGERRPTSCLRIPTSRFSSPRAARSALILLGPEKMREKS